jgi:hypothetical protein
LENQTSRRGKMKTLFTLLLLVGSAFAWPACSGNWNQVPNGTKSTATSGIGAIYAADDITWQCQSKTPQPPKSHVCQGGHNCNTTTASLPSTTISSSSSNSLSNASSVSSSNSNQHQSQGQSQTATGGNATGGNASNQGNNSTYSSITNVAPDKIPVNTAITPPVISTANCFKGFGGAIQTMPVGGSFGAGKVDKNCQILVTAAEAPSTLARCKVYITSDSAKRAGVTLEDCMATPSVTSTVVTTPVIVSGPLEPQAAVVNEQLKSDPTYTDFGNCHKLDNVCKANLDSLLIVARQGNGQITLNAHSDNYDLALRMDKYLVKSGIDTDRVVIVTSGDSVKNNVSLTYTEE